MSTATMVRADLALSFRPVRAGDFEGPFVPIEHAAEKLASWGPGLYTVDVDIDRPDLAATLDAEAAVDDEGGVEIKLWLPGPVGDDD